MAETNASASPAPKRCFTRLQHRRLWSPISTVRLCPSMDLIAYQLILQQQQQQHQSVLLPVPLNKPETHNGSGPISTTSQLCIHRTLNWQSIAAVSSKSTTSTVKILDLSTKPKAVAVETPQGQPHQVEWRPDGRFVAVATDDHVAVYCLESLLAGGTASSVTTAATTDLHGEDGSGSTGKVHSCVLDSTVTSLSWVHVRSGHSAWPDANDEVGHYWRSSQRHHRRQYVLPPSEYHAQNGSSSRATTNGGLDDASRWPTKHTPLSLLCVSTTSGLHLFLHGRYAIACNLPMVSPYNASLVVSADLTHIIGWASPSSISILSIPSLSQHRYELQTVAALYGNILQHVESIRNSVPEIAASWKSSLKALDLKLDGLLKLLDNYGLLSNANQEPGHVDSDEFAAQADNRMQQGKGTMCALLVQYILSGHTRGAPNLSNAMEQFFMSMQMNDQLVQRMERSLAGAVANVETSVRKQLVAPATALLYEVDQLYGLAAYRSDILATTTVLELLQTSQYLHLLIDSALVSLVKARSRLRDFCAWLRGMGAQIKARGTAANSVQRENAKKRRVPATIVHNILSYLQQPTVGKSNSHGKGTTEIVLGLEFVDYLNDNALDQSVVSPSSPQELTNKSSHTGPLNHSIPSVMRSLSALSDRVFAHPRSFLTQTIQRTSVQLPFTSAPGRVAITTRLGQGDIALDGVSYGEERPTGFFSPKPLGPVNSSFGSNSTECRQWLVAAQAIDGCSFYVHALPLTWTKTASDDFEDDETGLGAAFDGLWTARLSIPSDYTIRDVAFYGDDGKSSLSSSVNSGSGKEGRQQLGLLVSRSHASDPLSDASTTTTTTTVFVELWLLPYDDLEFSVTSLQREAKSDNSVILRCHALDETTSTYTVRPVLDSDSSDDLSPNSGRVVWARTREVFSAMDYTAEQDHPCRMSLSGSRGIGVVLGKQPGGTILEVLDLEEDEEDEDADQMDADDDDA